RPDDLAPAEDQELASEVGRSPGGVPDLLDVLERGRVFGELVGHELRVVDDDPEQVVEVVGDAAGELPDALHAASLVELLRPLAEELLAPVTEHRLRLPVDEHDPAAPVRADDRVGHELEELCERRAAHGRPAAMGASSSSWSSVANASTRTGSKCSPRSARIA